MTDTNDLVKELRTPVGFQDLPFIQEEAADRIEELEELLKAAQDDAKEAEAYAGELEANLSESKALLAKAVGALGDIYDGEPEWPDDPKRELEWCRNRAKRCVVEILAEIRGE